MSRRVRRWSGRWVARRLGVRLVDSPGAQLTLRQLAGLAVRRNPRRAHLIVSTVLGKHVPVRPALAIAAGRLLGLKVAAALGADLSGRPDLDVHAGLAALAAALDGGAIPRPAPPVALAEPPVVVGYAETATALGHLVADSLAGAGYLHSTRRRPAGLAPYAEFDEAHSHATEHLLYPERTSWLHRPAPLVLVDDELTTGRTAAQTIRALHAAYPRREYVIASLVDLRTGADRERLDALGAELGATVRVVALAAGAVTLPEDVLASGAAVVAELERPDEPLPARQAPVRRVVADWPDGLPEGGRHGFGPGHRERFEAVIARAAAEVGAGLPRRGRVLVLGSEELMYAPLRLAGALPGDVFFSSTTRSPVLPVDDPGYAVRTRLEFPASDGPPATASTDFPGTATDERPGVERPARRFAYNVRGGRFAHVVLVVDAAADTAALWSGLVPALRAVARAVTVVTVPAYAPVPATAGVR